MTITFLVPACLTSHALPPKFKPTYPISPSIPLHNCCACCALSSPPKPFSALYQEIFFPQARQLFAGSLWKYLSPRVSWCRSIPIPPTYMSYNFPDTSLVPSISLGLCTRPFRTPVLGASRRKAFPPAYVTYVILLRSRIIIYSAHISS